MSNLTASQQSFIQMMISEDELARRGFELLLKRDDFDRFFDALIAAGLFDPARNPAPIPTEKPGLPDSLLGSLELFSRYRKVIRRPN